MKTFDKASISAKHEVPVGDVNAVKPELATTEAHAKLEQVESEDNPFLQKLLENYSTFPMVRRTLAYVFDSSKMLERRMSRPALSPFKNWKSENQLFKWSQIHLKPSIIDKKFIPSVDENDIICALGLLEDVRLWPQEMRNPVILPRVQLLLRHLHEKCGHCGY